MAGGRTCAFSSKSAALFIVKDEYALQSGKSDGKKGDQLGVERVPNNRHKSSQGSLMSYGRRTCAIGESSKQKLTSDGTTGVDIFSYKGKLFDGIVARTSYSLTTFLQTITSDNLLLFPHNASKPNTNLMKMLQEDETKARAQIYQSSNKLCLVRVLLHAFKEGSFEEGAVVCAPSLLHISVLKSSSSEGEEWRVTIPQSYVSSYFQEQPSRTWELKTLLQINLIDGQSGL